MKILLATTSSCGNLQTAGEVIWIMEQFDRIIFFEIWLPMETLFSKQMIVSLYSLAIPTLHFVRSQLSEQLWIIAQPLFVTNLFFENPWESNGNPCIYFNFMRTWSGFPPVSPKIAGGRRSRRLAKGHLPFSTLFELDGCFTVNKKVYQLVA